MANEPLSGLPAIVSVTGDDLLLCTDLHDVSGNPVSKKITITQTLSALSNATTSAAGLMSAADKTTLTNATSSSTASTLALRDGSGNTTFNALTLAVGTLGNPTVVVAGQNSGWFGDSSGNLNFVVGSSTAVQITAGGTLAAGRITGTTLALSGGITQAGGIVGAIAGLGAAVGNVGEYMVHEVANNTTSISNSTTINVAGVSTAMVTLTAGDWDVGGTLYCLTASATMTQLIGCISSTTASLANTAGVSALPLAFTTSTFNIKQVLPTQQFNVSGNTPIYLNAEAFFSAGTATVGGRVWARRSASTK